MVKTKESTAGGLQKSTAILFTSNFVFACFLKFVIPTQPRRITLKCVNQDFFLLQRTETGLSKIRTLLACEIEKIIVLRQVGSKCPKNVIKTHSIPF